MSLGISVFEYLKIWMSEDPLISKCAPLFRHLLFKHALTVC
jgi:hypothetical protein